MAKDKKASKDPIELAERKLKRARLKLQVAEEKHFMARERGRQAIEKARLRAAAWQAKASERVERRANALARAEHALAELTAPTMSPEAAADHLQDMVDEATADELADELEVGEATADVFVVEEVDVAPEVVVAFEGSIDGEGAAEESLELVEYVGDTAGGEGDGEDHVAVTENNGDTAGSQIIVVPAGTAVSEMAEENGTRLLERDLRALAALRESAANGRVDAQTWRQTAQMPPTTFGRARQALMAAGLVAVTQDAQGRQTYVLSETEAAR